MTGGGNMAGDREGDRGDDREGDKGGGKGAGRGGERWSFSQSKLVFFGLMCHSPPNSQWQPKHSNDPCRNKHVPGVVRSLQVQLRAGVFRNTE